MLVKMDGYRMSSIGNLHMQYMEFEFDKLKREIATLNVKNKTLTEKLDQAHIDLDKANTEADFFKQEVQLRNRIPSTNDTAADLMRRVEECEYIADEFANFVKAFQILYPLSLQYESVLKVYKQYKDQYNGKVGLAGS